jgi:adenosylhomocysteine nucleosidase
VILIIAATDLEVRPWLQVCAAESGTTPIPKLRPGQCVHFDNKDPAIALLCTGVGATATRKVLPTLADLQPRVVIHVGFAGGLRAGINAGDLVLVTAVAEEPYALGSGALPAPRALPDHILNPLRSRLAELPDRMAQGAILTCDRFVDRAEDKRALSKDSTYLACEMEAALVRASCDELGITYVGIRAISDAEDHDVPIPQGEGHRERLRCGLRILSSPQAAVSAARMYKGRRRAAAALGRAIPRALEVIEVHALV